MERLVKNIVSRLRHLAPTYYRLGVWRTEYLSAYCCVCGVNFAKPPKSLHLDLNQKASPNPSHWLNLAATYASLICLECHQDIKWLPKPTIIEATSLDSSNQLSSLSQTIQVQSAAAYAGFIKSAMVDFKYNENLNALPILVHALRQIPRPTGHYSGNSVLLSVPTTSHRLNKRGFDPVTILSYYLSVHWNIPLWNGVSRIDNALSQKGLNRQERHQNIRNAFQLNALPPTKRIILFDDVVTTGSTLKELASCINKVPSPLILSAYSVTRVMK